MNYNVYEIVDPTSEEVVYVGQTKRLSMRIKEHTLYDYPSRPAKFLGFNHNVLATGLTKVASLDLEYKRKMELGLHSEERGNRTWIRKMDFEQAEEMRELYATGDYTYQDLIKIFPVNSSNSIYRIIHRKTYIS
mgnify:CR=1 FL=1|tara:strand:+ start:124 stop:525 length:402 start_codon:yes stop_codon:yes gene_type:complete